MAARPSNIGIKAMEIYFPSQCVEQAEFEKHQGVSAGKYTIGLGQTKMSFCDDREDTYSLALTTVSALLKKHAIDPLTIGHLSVGTESPLDKSKSCKSVLMQLFAPHGNTSLEGVDVYHACYGGTAALLAACAWLESSAWDGRDAIVVASDIALYAPDSPARATGGAGCVAMLVGPGAPLVLEDGGARRGTYMTHTYDFYKPDMRREYPYLDGAGSVRCYGEAVEACYREYQKRASELDAVREETSGEEGKKKQEEQQQLFVDTFDHFAFHAPNCKLVAKSYARLLHADFLAHPAHPAFSSLPSFLRADPSASSFTDDKEVEKAFMKLSAERFAARVQPSLEAPTMCGNMYTASVFAALASLLSNVPAPQLLGKRIGVFSFGSGLASTMYSLRVVGDVGEMVGKMDLKRRLEGRIVRSPHAYEEACKLREQAYGRKDYAPVGDVGLLAKGTYYLVGVDDMFRRTYAVKE